MSRCAKRIIQGRETSWKRCTHSFFNSVAGTSILTPVCRGEYQIGKTVFVTLASRITPSSSLTIRAVIVVVPSDISEMQSRSNCLEMRPSAESSECPTVSRRKLRAYREDAELRIYVVIHAFTSAHCVTTLTQFFGQESGTHVVVAAHHNNRSD